MTWTSPYFSTSNTYIKYCIKVDETATSTVNNTSTIRVRVLAWRTNTGYTTNYDGKCWVKIDGSYAPGSPNTWEYGDKPITYNSDTVLCDLTGISITHDTNGTKTIQVAACFDLYASGSTKVTSSYQSFDVTLTNLDQVTPTVTITPSNIGVSGFTLGVATNVACDIWQYSINGGSNWTQFSTTSGTSASTNITGLSPNTSYTVLAKARKASNQLYGTSASSTVTTIGNTTINSVNTVTADNSTVQIVFNATVYVSSYTHTLVLKDGSTSVLTIQGLTLATGNNTITLTSTQRTTLLTYMASMKSFTGTFELTTLNGSTQIGDVSSTTGTVTTTAANSSPTFTTYTYKDNNATTTAITGNNQIMIQGVSTLQVTATAATAKNNATIASYSVSFGNITGSSTTTTITPTGAITTSGTVVLTVSAVDSRGYSTSVTKNVTVIPYTSIAYTSASIRRVNDVENTIMLSFGGNISSINVSSIEKNSITYCQYRYKKTSDSSYGAYTNILSGVSTSSSTFSYDNSALVSLDADYSWNLQVLVKDALTERTLELTVGPGTPLVSFRSKKVGINNRTPAKALDVVGDTLVSGDITTTTLNSVTVGSDPKFTDTIGQVYYCETDSTSTTTAFVVTISGITALTDGLTLCIKNTKGTSASGCTINLNSLGAKSIWLSQDNAACTTEWKNNSTFLFIFDATNDRWVIYQGTNVDINANNIVSRYSRLVAGGNGVKKYSLFAMLPDGTYSSFTTNSGTGSKTFDTTHYFDIRKIFVYVLSSDRASGAAVSATSWEHQGFDIDMRYSFSDVTTSASTSSLVLDKPVYLVFDLSSESGGCYKLKSPYYTQTPNATGAIYVLVGVMRDSYRLDFWFYNPAFTYDGTKLVPFPEAPYQPTYSITKSSGNWSVDSINVYRAGSVVHMHVIFKGNGSSVSGGSNGFTGTLSGALPAGATTLNGYWDNSVLSMRINTNGSIIVRTSASITIGSSETTDLTGTFITKS